MTTNRIRTMDSAFQSRIHMAVRYEDLNADAREKIWKSLIGKLGEVSISDLEPNLRDLAKWRLNGRQIRNVLLVAQSLALKENQPLAYHHLKHTIENTLEFQRFFQDSHLAQRTNLGTNWQKPNDNQMTRNERYDKPHRRVRGREYSWDEPNDRSRRRSEDRSRDRSRDRYADQYRDRY